MYRQKGGKKKKHKFFLELFALWSLLRLFFLWVPCFFLLQNLENLAQISNSINLSKSVKIWLKFHIFFNWWKDVVVLIINILLPYILKVKRSADFALLPKKNPAKKLRKFNLDVKMFLRKCKNYQNHENVVSEGNF